MPNDASGVFRATAKPPRGSPSSISERPPDEAVLAIPAGGGSLRGMVDRVIAGCDRLVEVHPDETVLVVTHGGPLRVLLGDAKGMPLWAGLGSHH